MVLISLMLAGCHGDDHSGGTYREDPGADVGMILDPPAGWTRSEVAGLEWAALPPAGDPLSGPTRMTLTVVAMPDGAGRPSGKLQVTHLVEGRQTALPSGAFQTLSHRTATYGRFEGLETESNLVGTGGNRRVRQVCFWQGGRQYTLTLETGDAQYEAASAIFRQVAEAARHEDNSE